jgi:hypothetical protein
MGAILRFDPELRRLPLDRNRRGASMGEVVRFVSSSERERARLVREARAIYDGIFPPTDPPKVLRDRELGDQEAANPGRGDRSLS